MKTSWRARIGGAFLTAIAIVVVVIALTVVLQLVFRDGGSSSASVPYSYSNFIQDLRRNRVAAAEVNVNDQSMIVTLTSGEERATGYVDATTLAQELAQHRQSPAPRSPYPATPISRRCSSIWGAVWRTWKLS